MTEPTNNDRATRARFLVQQYATDVGMFSNGDFTEELDTVIEDLFADLTHFVVEHQDLSPEDAREFMADALFFSGTHFEAEIREEANR